VSKGTLESTAYIGLGANLGDREGALEAAVAALDRGGAVVTARSSVYRTEPVEVIDQEEFLNQVVACATALQAPRLLRLCLEIERSMGRVRTRDKGPRVIDLDLLTVGNQVLHSDGLELPHPRLHLRRFVLVPLAEIAPDVRHPVLGLTMTELLARCPDRSRVERHGPGAGRPA
jgi:2-amino-4-hydroxy-6-hydroxymethyldihydropteridine diphosphokinase